MKPRHRPPRIAFFGTVGGNLGDEAVAVVAARFLRARESDLEIRVGTVSPGTITMRYPDLGEFSIGRRSPAAARNFAREVHDADVVLLGGGTMIQDKLGISPVRGMIPYMFQVVALARFFGKPVFSLPIGIDELSTRLGRTMARSLIRGIQVLWVRDETSRRLARAYAGKDPDIRLGADPAFLLGNDPLDCLDLAPTPPLPLHPRPYVAVSLARENVPVDHYFEPLATTLVDLMLTRDLDLLLVPMDRREHEESFLFNKLRDALEARGLNAGRIGIVDPSLPVGHIAALLRGATLLIAMRLHAMILAAGAAPIVALSRATKTDTFARDFGLPAFSLAAPIPADALRAAADTHRASPIPPRVRLLREEHVRRAAAALDDLLTLLRSVLRPRAVPVRASP